MSCFLGEHELRGIDSFADLELRAVLGEETFQADGSATMLVRGRDRLALPKPTVETDREAPGRTVVVRATHSYDTVDVRKQCLLPSMPSDGF